MSEEKPTNVGVSNPYALTEVLLKKRVAWHRIDNPRKLLEKTLKMSYDKLFDPANNSPLFAGLEYKRAKKELQRIRVPSAAPFQFRVLLEIAETDDATVWEDPGDYFEEGAELFNPIQGSVANCYFIAALASVAWARTYIIAHRTRSTSTDGEFLDMIEFYTAGNAEKVEVTERLPLTNPDRRFIYARSSDEGEIWPAVYEKAYAKWTTNDPSDTPDITATAFGDPVGATAQITGLTPHYYSTQSMTADEIWSKVRSNSISFKTFNPMVAWTYSSGNVSPDNVNYADASLVANHAYTILGCYYINNQMYVVLRNPWGCREATLNVVGGSWTAWDAPYCRGPGWWRPIDVPREDGIFSLRVNTFKQYFSGLGYVE